MMAAKSSSSSLTLDDLIMKPKIEAKVDSLYIEIAIGLVANHLTTLSRAPVDCIVSLRP